MAIGSDNGRTPAGGFRRNPCRILNVLGKNWDRISRYIRQTRLATYKCLDSPELSPSEDRELTLYQLPHHVSQDREINLDNVDLIVID
jgi:hypothetical protein